MKGLLGYCHALLSAAVLLGLVGHVGAAQSPRASESKSRPAVREETPPFPAQVPSEGTSSDKKPANVAPWEGMKFPASTIFVLYEEAKEALRFLPKLIVLTPEEYQRLLDQIEQAKRLTKSDKPEIPSVCRLTGRAEGELVYLEARFELRTIRPNTTVHLGCQRAWARDAKLDGQLPLIQLGEDGYFVQVERPGEHKIVLDLVLPSAARRGAKGADKGFELDLPHAAITTLDQFDLAEAPAEIRVGSRPVQAIRLDPQRSRLENVPISSIDHLEISWKSSVSEPAKGPILTATGRISVRVSEVHALTDVDLTLQVLRGETARWEIAVPGLPSGTDLEVKVPPPDEQRVQSIDRAIGTEDGVVTIRLKEPSGEPLRVILQIDQRRPGGRIPVGPFSVFGALPQKGEIEVRAPDDLRLRVQPRGQMFPREISEEQRRDNMRAAFTYWNLPAPSKSKQALQPFLVVQTEPIKGAVETRVEHDLHLLDRQADPPPHWQLKTTIKVKPIRTGVDHLDISLPPGYELDKTTGNDSPDIVEEIFVDSQKRSAQLRLATKRLDEFSVRLHGTYPFLADRQDTSLELPRPLTWSVDRIVSGDRVSLVAAPAEVLDRGGQVAVSLPPTLELLARPFQGVGGPVGRNALQSLLVPVTLRTGQPNYTLSFERAPPRVDLTWRARSTEVVANSVIDVIVAAHQARIRQRMQFSSSMPERIILRCENGLLGNLRIIEGGKLLVDTKSAEAIAVELIRPAGQEPHLLLEYSISLPEAVLVEQEVAKTASREGVRSKILPRRFSVPFLQPAQSTRGETRVRLWSDSGEQLRVTGGSWEELPIEVVPEHDSLPVLVVRSKLDSSLSLPLTASASAPLGSAVVDRVLVQAILGEGGHQTYRVQFLVSKISGHHLDIELPIPLSSPNLEIQLDGKRMPAVILDEDGRDASIGRLARLRVEPDLYSKAVLLSVRYEIDVGQFEGQGLLRANLRPPALQGAVLVGRPRWRVDVPSGWMPVYPKGAYPLEERWAWQGWLLAPLPAASAADLEQWLTSAAIASSTQEDEPSLVCWQSSLAPLRVFLLPQRIWLLLCSLLFLGLGLGLFFTPLSQLLFWSCVVLGSATLAAVGLFWPSVLPVLAYGCEPGVAMLLLVIGMHWLLQQRYRHRVVFMPGFVRLKPGSSLTRAGSGSRSREPSTIDQPPARGNPVLPETPPARSRA